MRSFLIGLVVGTGWLQLQAALPSRSRTILLLVVAVLTGAAAHAYARHARRTIKVCAWLACGSALGFVWAAWLAQVYLSRELPVAWEGRDVTVVGTIDSLPSVMPQGVRFNFTVEHGLGDGPALQAIPGRLVLSWYAGRPENRTQAGVVSVHPGERWRLTVRLQRPHGNANPYGFDYEAWLLEQGLRATGYVRPDPENTRLDPWVFSLRHAVERTREWLRLRIESALAGQPYAGVIVALVIGDQQGIGQTDWTVFNRTGVGHLISISGLHITLIAGMAAACAFSLWRRSFFTGWSLPLMLPAQKVAALAGVGVAFLYVALAGFGIPAQRTLVMLTVIAVAMWTGRIVSPSHVLCYALATVVLFDPWAVLWPGFWLSFGAVAMILYASVGRAGSHVENGPILRRARESLRSAAAMQYVVTLGLVPLSLLLFGQISLVGPLANAVAIPVVSFLVTPLSLAGSLSPAPLSSWLLVSAHSLVVQLARGLAWLSDLPGAVWAAPVPSTGIFLSALCGTIWMLAPRGWPVRWLGLLAWIPIVFNTPETPAEGEVRMTAFDVGQGTAVLIETRSHILLYDSGPAYTPESDGGNRVILPYLRSRGIHRLDGMMLSHSDTDHVGGAASILAGMPVGWVSSSLPLSHPLLQKIPVHYRCEAGQRWQWDGVRFDILHPSAESHDMPGLSPNARSCTLKVTSGSHAILLPGDIEAGQERELLARSPDQLQADVLVAPHHGSGTSSTPGFLHAVAPALAVFQMGYRNRYHHPKSEVYARYAEFGIRRLRSDESGAITVQMGAEELTVDEYRNVHRRYWYGK